jgi:hypothetical protein
MSVLDVRRTNVWFLAQLHETCGSAHRSNFRDKSIPHRKYAPVFQLSFVFVISPFLPILLVVLLLRTYALYHRNHAILLLLSVAWAVATAAGIVSTPLIAWTWLLIMTSFDARR